nr:mitochondrial import receptor subunit TOM40-1-like [Tanacetum cinerariifolium]
MDKVVEDVGDDDDFKSATWVSATNYVNTFGGTVTGCLGDVNNFLNNGKLELVVGIVKSCSSNMLGDLNVTMKDLSSTIPRTIHHKVIGSSKEETKTEKKVDYMDLPCPIPYEEIQRENLMSLKADYFEGMRVDFTKGLNHKFSLSHSINMGATEIPSQSSEIYKVPTANYEFGANYIDPKLMLIGRVMTDGRVSARGRCELTENLSFKVNAQLTSEPNMSNGIANFDYKGRDYRAQFQLGNGELVAANYIQSVTPNFSLGGEVFWAGQQHMSGLGYGARYDTDKMVATGQIATTGMVALGYVQKVSEKVSLASDLMYNYMSREAIASFGYDYRLHQSRLRGKIDSNGRISTYLEERLNMGLNFILSAEIDHKKKDYKFGFGLTVGE